MQLWPGDRAASIVERIRACFGSSRVPFCFHSSAQVDSFWGRYGYLPTSGLLEDELGRLSPDPFVVCQRGDVKSPCVHLFVCGGSTQEAGSLWKLRNELGNDAVICIWLWDNHWGYAGNIACALAADLVFVSHHYASSYLFQPAAVVADHVPACSAQWTTGQAADFMHEVLAKERKHKALVNYVNYGDVNSNRRRLLESYAQGLDCADVFLMPSDDRSRYSDLDPRQRFSEWTDYKATVIVPVDRDLSTRVFDALLSGMIPVVPTYIDDLYKVIPPEVQNELGIVLTDSLELAEVRVAAAHALETFDAQGTEGVLRRHRYALQNHMLINRVTDMLHHVWKLGVGDLTIDFRPDAAVPGLYLSKASR